MSVGVFARWTEAFPRHLAASRTFVNSSVPVSAMDVGHRSRKLSDASACAPPGATSWMGRVNKFLLNEAYGAVLLNMIADVLVRCMMYLLLPLLALKFCRGARNKELESTLERLKQALDKIEDREKAFLDPDSNFCRMFESALSASKSGHCVHISSNGHGQPCGDADSTVSSASTSEVVKRIPKNGYSESYVEPYHAEYISGTLKTTPETSSIADHASTSTEKVQEGALKPDIKQRVDHFIKHLHANKECSKVDGEETVTASSSSNGGDSHIMNMPIQAVLPGEVPLPTSSTRLDVLKMFLVAKLGAKVVEEMFSSRILLGSVETTERNLGLLRDYAIEGMKIDRGFTLQIGKSYLYHCTGDRRNPALLSLRDIEVPTILQAEYVAGVLTVRGRFLEGAELRAATSEEYLILQPEKQTQVYPNGIEEWRCYSPIVLSNKPIHIFASREVCVDNRYLTVRSEPCPMVDNTLRTLIREWVPASILTIFVLYHMYHLYTEVSDFIFLLPFQQLWLPYVGVALMMGILHTLPDRVDITIRRILDHIKLAYLTVRLAPQALTYPSWKRKEVATQGTSPISIDANSDIKKDEDNHVKKEMIKDIDKDITQKDATKSSEEKDEQNTGVNTLEWQWPISKQRYSKSKHGWENVKEIRQKNEGLRPFEVVYRSQTIGELDNSVLTNLPKRIVIKVFSTSLQEILKELLPQCLRDCDDHKKIQGQQLFSLYQQDVLQRTLTSMDPKQSPTAKMPDPNSAWFHLFHLIRFVEKEYETIILQHQRMVHAGVITWDTLWTLILVNDKVVFYCDISKEQLCGKVLSCLYTTADSRFGKQFEVDLEVWDYDCVSYGPKTLKRRIPEFFQESMISNMDVHPIKYGSNVQDTEAYFFKRGKRYHELIFQSERCYLQYKGFMFWSKIRAASNPRHSRESMDGHSRESMDGHVMVDQGAYSKMKSSRSMGTAQPRNGWSQGSVEQDKRKLLSESDENLQFCPAVVYGFSFSIRRWGCFVILGLQEITFDPTVFNTLVMNDERSKQMLLAMTQYYLKKPLEGTETSFKEVEVDPLPNKGKGCIILLHGPPGTGKTFTVEALAEKMECPLWQLTVTTVGKTPKQIETKLMRKFEVAALWGAILLLDEADVYLSSRKYSPLATDASQGNALTGVFLRVLEYYQGILFLTTNEPGSLEPAIDSRISLSIQYNQFDIAQRRQLWSTFMERVGIDGASPAFWKEVLRAQLNGRVIRNIVSNAKIFSISQGIELNEGHILYAFRVRLSTMRGVVLNDATPEFTDGGQDSISCVPSYITHEEDE